MIAGGRVNEPAVSTAGGAVAASAAAGAVDEAASAIRQQALATLNETKLKNTNVTDRYMRSRRAHIEAHLTQFWSNRIGSDAHNRRAPS